MSYSLINCRNRKDSKKSWRQTEQVMEIAKVVSLRSHPQPCPHPWQTKAKRSGGVSAATSGAVSVKPVSKGCQKCGGKGAIECPGCKGTGKNKKNGNIFERWKCFDCQGFGLKSCPSCGKGGLTPEQRGER